MHIVSESNQDKVITSAYALSGWAIVNGGFKLQRMKDAALRILFIVDNCRLCHLFTENMKQDVDDGRQ